MDEVATLVANTLIAKGGEALMSAGTSAVRALVVLVRRRFGRNTADTEALEGAIAYPDEETQRGRLVAALAEAMRHDPAFARELQVHWQAASVELGADRGSVVNRFDGWAQKVVQARDIHGDLSL